MAVVLMAALAEASIEWVLPLVFIAVISNAVAFPALPPAGWSAVDTHFAKLSSGVGLSDVMAAMSLVDWLVKFADTVPANSVQVLPETILGPVGTR